VDVLSPRRLVGARGPAQHPIDELAGGCHRSRRPGARSRRRPRAGPGSRRRAFEVREPTDQLGHAFGESAHALSGLSPAIRTWILSFLTRYQRLRSVIRGSWRRGPAPRAPSGAHQGWRAAPLLERLVERPLHDGRRLARGGGLGATLHGGGQMLGQDDAVGEHHRPSSTCCSSRMFPGHGYVHRQRRASVESVAGWRQRRVAARSRRCVTS